VVNIFEFIDASDPLLEEWTSEILLSNLQFFELAHLISLLRLNYHHVVFMDFDNPVQNILVQFFYLVF
jgi:hypothetical protein